MKIKVTLATEKDALFVMNFLLRNYIYLRKWPIGMLLSWINWYCLAGFCTISEREDNSVIVGLLMGRPMLNTDKVFVSPWDWSMDGDIFFIDTICTSHSGCIPFLAQKMIESVGMKNKIAFTRDHGNMKTIHVWPTLKFVNKYASRKK